MNELMPKGYFDEVQKHMVGEGFALIARVAINHTQCEYHVPCTMAANTSLFFHIHGKSVIIKLEYSEDDYHEKGNNKGCWKVTFYFRFKSYGKLLEENPHWLGQSTHDSLYHDMPILGSTPFVVKGFGHSNWVGGFYTEDRSSHQVSFFCEEEHSIQEDHINARILSARISEAVRTVTKYVDSKRLYGISLHNFLPYYTFGGQFERPDKDEKLETIFWQQFDWGYFRHLVVRPSGYNYHRIAIPPR
jgi:hypothetical protein